MPAKPLRRISAPDEKMLEGFLEMIWLNSEASWGIEVGPGAGTMLVRIASPTLIPAAMEDRSAGKLEMAAASWLLSVIWESCRAWTTLAGVLSTGVGVAREEPMIRAVNKVVLSKRDMFARSTDLVNFCNEVKEGDGMG